MFDNCERNNAIWRSSFEEQSDKSRDRLVQPEAIKSTHWQLLPGNCDD
jgi:hypothetical protein